MYTSRREFMKSALGGLALAAQGRNTTLLEGGWVVSLDPSIGDFARPEK